MGSLWVFTSNCLILLWQFLGNAFVIHDRIHKAHDHVIYRTGSEIDRRDYINEKRNERDDLHFLIHSDSPFRQSGNAVYLHFNLIYVL